MGPNARPELEKEAPLTLDEVLPGNLPKPVDRDIQSNIYEITCMDYFTDHDRESRVMRYFKLLEEMYADSEVAILQMQENVDPVQIPSASATVGLFVQQLTNFDVESIAKIQTMAIIVDDRSGHAKAERRNLTAVDWLREAEKQYLLGVMKFRRQRENFKRKYGEELYSFEQLQGVDPLLASHLRQKLPSHIEFDNGELKEDSKKRQFSRWRERMIMDLSYQGDVHYRNLRSAAWRADLMINAVHKMAKGYGRIGSAGLRRSMRSQEQQAAKRETQVQVVNR